MTEGERAEVALANCPWKRGRVSRAPDRKRRSSVNQDQRTRLGHRPLPSDVLCVPEGARETIIMMTRK